MYSKKNLYLTQKAKVEKQNKRDVRHMDNKKTTNINSILSNNYIECKWIKLQSKGRYWQDGLKTA